MSKEAARIHELVEQIKQSSPFEGLEATRKLIDLSRRSESSQAEKAARAASAAPALDEQVRAALAALKARSVEYQAARAGASLRDPILDALRDLENAIAAAGAPDGDESEPVDAST
jgi:hypothetical protein